MKDYREYVLALKKCAVEHDNDSTSFGHIKVSDLCRATANLLEELEQVPCVTMKNLSDEELKHFAEEMKKARPQVIQQEPCEDAISRECLLDDSKYHTVFNDDTGVFEDVVYREDIKKAPPVNPKPKTGHWMKSNIGGAKVCSVCNAHMGLSSFKFCPNCGTKMVEPQESENP